MTTIQTSGTLQLCQRPVIYEFTAWEVRDHAKLNAIRHVVRDLNVSPTALREWLTATQRDAGVWVLNPIADVRTDIDLSAVFEQDDYAPCNELEGRSVSDFMAHHFGPRACKFVAPRLSRLGVARMQAIGTVTRMHIARQSQRLGLPKAANDNRPRQRGPRCPECGHQMMLPLR